MVMMSQRCELVRTANRRDNCDDYECARCYPSTAVDEDRRELIALLIAYRYRAREQMVKAGSARSYWTAEVQRVESALRKLARP